MSRTLLLAALACLPAAAGTKPEYEMTTYVVGFLHRRPNAGRERERVRRWSESC